MARYQYSHRKESLPPSRKPTSDFLQPRPFPPIPEAQESAPSSLNPNIPPPQFSIAEPQGSRPQPLQPKLTLGAPDDKYEQEADRVASQVVQHINSPTINQANPAQSVQRETLPEEDELQMKPMLQREAIPEKEELQMKPMLQRMEIPEEEELQMKSAPSAGIVEGDASPNLETGIQQARGGGQALAPDLQTKMGQAMGADFSQVRVHTDSQSDQLNRSIQAKAFTTGQDIFFRQGAYQPGNQGGQELIAHELTHVMQQNSLGRIDRTVVQLWPLYEVNPSPHGSFKCHDAVFYWILRDMGKSSHFSNVLIHRIYERGNYQASYRWIGRGLGYSNGVKITKDTIDQIQVGDILFTGSANIPTHSMICDSPGTIQGYNNGGTFGGPVDQFEQHISLNAPRMEYAERSLWDDTGNMFGIYGAPLYRVPYGTARTHAEKFINYIQNLG